MVKGAGIGEDGERPSNMSRSNYEEGSTCFPKTIYTEKCQEKKMKKLLKRLERELGLLESIPDESLEFM